MEKKLTKDVCKPNLFLIGAPKCGTTALYYNLSQNSNIFLPKIKELRYFDRDVFYDFAEDYRTKTIDEYLTHYQDTCDFKYRMDGSIFIMYSIEAVKEILQFSPDSKFIIILRNPIEASVSMFKQRLSYIDPKMREICDDFNKCWSLKEERERGEGFPKGCRNKFIFRYDLLYKYENYIPSLIEILGDKLFIGFYDEYKTQPKIFFEKLSNFLELDLTLLENKKHNVGYTLKSNLFLKGIDNIYKGIGYLAQTTFPIRKKLGLIGIGGKQISSIKDKIYKNFEMEIKINPSAEVEEYFQQTIEYMNKLRKKY